MPGDSTETSGAMRARSDVNRANGDRPERTLGIAALSVDPVVCACHVSGVQSGGAIGRRGGVGPGSGELGPGDGMVTIGRGMVGS
jgi:hypothetical protein